MLILLPPSERKVAATGRAAPTRLHELAFPELTPARQRVRDALVALGDDDAALAVLGISAALRAEATANRRLPTAPARPAMTLFSGVLYDALAWDQLDAASRRRAAPRLLVMSALYGAIGPSDRVSAYRLSMDAALPGLPPLALLWRDALGPVLQARAEERGAVVDCRSAAYAAAWTPRGDPARRGVTVGVVLDRAGERSVVSHLAKHTRGEVARHLLEAGGRDPRDADAVAHRLSSRWRVELGPASGRDRLRRLDVVLST